MRVGARDRVAPRLQELTAPPGG